MKYCDLHVHTIHSDASRSVEEVMTYAKMTGIQYIAITDHDTMAGVEKAEEIGEKMGIQVIPGVEISTRDEETGRSVHMLCYHPQNRGSLDVFLRETRRNRREQKLAMVEKVQKIYPLLTKEIVEEYAKNSDSIYECHIMQPLCDMGYSNTVIGELMESLISSKGSCFVKGKYPTTKEAVNAIREAGGIAVVAHAQQFNSFGLVERYAKEGLIQGVEVWHPRNDAKSRSRLLELAKQYNLLRTGGSDFHGQYTKRPKPLGYCGCGVEDLKRLVGNNMREIYNSLNMTMRDKKY